MADERISQLRRLPKDAAAATDVLPIVDISASQTKKIQLDDLVAAGVDLIPSGEIDLSKLDQSSATKLGTSAIASGAITAAQLADDSSVVVDTATPSGDTFDGRGYFNSSTGNLQIFNGTSYQQVVMPSGGIGDLQVITAKLADGAVTTAKVSPLGSAAYASGSVGTAALASGAVTAEKIASGTITAAQFSAGAINNAALGSAAVTYDKIQSTASGNVLLGAVSSGTIVEIPCTAAGRAVLAAADTTEQRAALGLGSLAQADGTWVDGSTVDGTCTGTNTGDQTITLTGDVTGTGTGSFAATITNGAITEAKYAALSIPTEAVQDDAITADKLADQSAAIVSNAAPSGDGAFIGQQWINVSTAAVYSWTGVEWLQHDVGQLLAEDIPNLDAAKIVSGELPTDRLAPAVVTRPKLANYSIGSIGETFPSADFITQLHFNPLNKTFYMWDGNVYQPIGISSGAVIFAGTYDAGDNEVDTVTSAGQALGLTVGSPLPSAAAANAGYYLVVSASGTGTSPAPTSALAPPDILLSTGNQWTEIDVSSGYAAQAASNIAFTPSGTIAATNVQAAIEEVSGDVEAVSTLATAALPKAGGTISGQVLIGTAGSLVFEGSVDDGFETALAVVNPTADRTITFPNETGTIVTTGSSGAITNAMVANEAAIALSKLATGVLPSGITVASVNIVDGTIVDADVNASAAIAGTKISPNFGSQAISTTGSATAGRVNVIDNTIPQSGLFRPADTILGFSAGTREGARLFETGGLRQFSNASASTAAQFTSANGAGTSNNLIAGLHSATSFSDGTTSFVVRTNGNVLNTNNSYGSLSDEKLKENIVDASSQWADIKAIRVRNYNFKEGQKHKQIGVVAQEVEAVCPGLVTSSPDRDDEGNDLGTETKAVSYSVLFVKAVKALQEAMARIETLESEVAALKH